MVVLGTILLTAFFSALSEIAAITFPSQVITMASLSADDIEEGSVISKFGVIEKLFLYASFAYFLLIPLLLFSEHLRFIYYGLFYLCIAILGKTSVNRFLLKKTSVIVLSAIQLFLLLDIIRSCFITIQMR